MKNLNIQCKTLVTLNFDRSTCKWTLSLHMKKKQLHCFATLTGYTSKPESKLAFRCMLTALWEAEIKHYLFPFTQGSAWGTIDKDSKRTPKINHIHHWFKVLERTEHAQLAWLKTCVSRHTDRQNNNKKSKPFWIDLCKIKIVKDH